MDPTAELRERDALIDRIRPYAEATGLYALTLASVAEELQMPLARLQDFFADKEELIAALIADYRITLRAKFATVDFRRPDAELYREMWETYRDMPAGNLYFEAFGYALHDDHYKDFLSGTNDWLSWVRGALVARGVPSDRADAVATLTIAVFRGALVDLLASGDRARVNRAVALFVDLVTGVPGDAEA